VTRLIAILPIEWSDGLALDECLTAIMDGPEKGTSYIRSLMQGRPEKGTSYIRSLMQGKQRGQVTFSWNFGGTGHDASKDRREKGVGSLFFLTGGAR
jgi:hypothetical protein